MRKRWIALIAVVLAGVVALWGLGTFDRALAPWGLNSHACARNGFGVYFCGAELTAKQEEEKAEALKERREEEREEEAQQAKQSAERAAEQKQSEAEQIKTNEELREDESPDLNDETNE